MRRVTAASLAEHGRSPHIVLLAEPVDKLYICAWTLKNLVPALFVFFQFVQGRSGQDYGIDHTELHCCTDTFAVESESAGWSPGHETLRSASAFCTAISRKVHSHVEKFLPGVSMAEVIEALDRGRHEGGQEDVQRCTMMYNDVQCTRVQSSDLHPS